MKIGMLVDRYKPYVSGITNYISVNKKYLEAAGHQVCIFTFGDEEYSDEETRVIRSPGFQLSDTGYYFNVSYNRHARRLLYTMDVAHVHHPLLSGSMALRYCRPRGIPIIFTNHTRYDLYTHAYAPTWMPDSLGEAAMRTFLPGFCRAIDLVIAPSPGLAEVLQRFGVDAEMEVVPNGVDLSPFRSAATPIERSQLNIPDEAVVLIYVGRLGPEKNLPFLLRCFSGVAQAYPEVHLLLVGDGPERDNLEDRAGHMELAGRVHFTGLIPYDQLPGYLRLADAFVTASVTEVHPLSVIEALAAGLPVLGTHSPGVGDSVIDGETGLLAEEDLAEFTAKMVRLVVDGDLRRSLGAQASQSAERFAIERTSAQMIEVYTKVVKQAIPRKTNLRARLRRLFDPGKNG